MAHVDVQTIASSGEVQRFGQREIVHIDRCMTCRRRALECGLSDRDIATMLAAAGPRTRAFLTAGLLAAALGVVAVAAPLRGAALGFVRVFEPHTVAAVPLTLDDMRSLGHMPDLSAYATTRVLRASSAANFVDMRAATAAAGFRLRQPMYLPDGIRAVSYAVNSGSAQLLTFIQPGSSPRARTSQSPLPADISGSTLRIELGASVLAAYETRASSADEQRFRRALLRLNGGAAGRPMSLQSGRSINSSPSLLVPNGRTPGSRLMEVHTSVRGVRRQSTGAIVFSSGSTGFLPLVVVQMPVPRVESTGVSVERLASFMLSQPGIPPRVAAAFGALGDLSTTLPIPIPIDKAYTQPVFVDGVQGLGVGDDTGIGAAVVWQKNSMLYAVFATRTAHDVLAIANSLR